MTFRLNTLLLSSSLALSLLMTTPAMADESNKRTKFEFSAPVQIPGHVLAAGKYVFQIMDAPADRNIVQVFSEDADGRETLIATILAIPDYRDEIPDKPLVNLEERRADTPEAIHSWFYPEIIPVGSSFIQRADSGGERDHAAQPHAGSRRSRPEHAVDAPCSAGSKTN